MSGSVKVGKRVVYWRLCQVGFAHVLSSLPLLSMSCMPVWPPSLSSVRLPLALGVQENGASFEGSMLKLLRTLPKVLKYLPMDKAAVCVCMCAKRSCIPLSR